MHAVVRIALALPAVSVAAFSIFQTSRVARADLLAHQDTVTTLAAASRLLPRNAQFHARLAELDPGRSSELERALVLNPRNASWWIMRSVQQEEAGDLPGAEASLRSAFRIARYYVPLWSLTAFYYREGNKVEFIHSAKETLSVGTGDPRSVFQMAARLGVPADVVQNEILPDQTDTLTAYLKYTLETGDWRSATNTGIHLAAVGSKDDTPALLTASERLFLSGNLNEAVIVWNSAVSAHWISMTRMNPASGVSFNDGAFAQPRIYLGFDWKVPAPAEVAVAAQSLFQRFSYFAARAKIFWYFDPAESASGLGPFLNHDHFASFIALVLPVAAVEMRKRGTSQLGFVLAIAGFYAAVVASGSRAGFAVVTLEIMILLALVGSFRRLMLPLLGMILVFAAVVGWGRLWERFHIAGSFTSRGEINRVTLAIIKSSPWKGTGLGTWTLMYPAFAERDIGLFANAAHNDWLQWTAEGGVSLLAIMATVCYSSVQFARRIPWALGLPMVLLHCIIEFPMQGRFFPAMFFLIFGVAARAYQEESTGHARS